MDKKRITIVIDVDTLKKCRLKQANRIRATNKSVSLSSIINEATKRGI